MLVDLQRGVDELSAEYGEACRSGIPYLGGDYPPTSTRCKQTMADLERIILIIKRKVYIRQDHFDIGSKVGVIGVPFMNSATEKMEIFAFDMIEDHHTDRDLEINFKQTLYEFYNEKYLS